MSDTRREDKRIVLIIAWGCWSSAHLPRYCDPYCFNLQSTLPLFFTEHCNGILPPIQSSMSIFVMLWIHCRSAPLLSLALSTKVSHQSTLPLNVIRLPFRWAILLIHLCMSSCQTKRPRGQKKGWSALLQLRQWPPPLSIRNWRGSRPYPDVSCDYIKRSDFSRDNRQPCSSDKHSSSDNRTWQHCWYNSNVVLQCADVCVRQNRLISTFVLSSASSGGRCVHSIGVRKIKNLDLQPWMQTKKEKNLGGSILI